MTPIKSDMPHLSRGDRQRSVVLAVVALVAVATSAAGQGERVRPPVIPTTAISGGRVVLDLETDDGARVTAVTVVEGTPPFTQPTVDAVREWTLQPSQHALVVAVFRPPTLLGGALAPPKPTEQHGDALPFPSVSPLPPYPVDGAGDAVVIVATQIDREGRVGEARVIAGAGAFAEAALSTLPRWRFRPPSSVVPDSAGAAAYLVFAFRQPIVAPTETEAPAAVPGT